MRTLALEAALAALFLLPGSPAAAAPFQRGDIDASGKRELGDAVAVLRHLFLSEPPSLDCADAADANDDGSVDLADAVHILFSLFGEIGPLPDPYWTCGFDPTGDDALGCASFAPCLTCGGILGESCPEGMVCETPPGACCCDIAGACVPRPTACPEYWDPVCGCDGQTYGNDCERLQAGAGKAHDGPCKSP